MKFMLILCCILVLFNIVFAERKTFGNCSTSYYDDGECVFLSDCRDFKDTIDQETLSDYDEDFISSSQCGFIDGQYVVCCQKLGKLLPKRGIVCGTNIRDRIHDGEFIKLGDFPWSALLEYTDFDGFKHFGCGGSLINHKYVVTAGHCVNFRTAQSMLSNVRLGEYVISTPEDWDNTTYLYNICAPPALDFAIEQIILHENYNPMDKNKHNDIALIRLQGNVTFTNYISPICLPMEDSNSGDNLAGESIIAAGWGATETARLSDIKLKATLKMWSHDECRKKYNNMDIKPHQFCAGGEGTKDTCSGDSGSPLAMLNRSSGIHHWVLIGVVSFGPNPCGQDGWPGVNIRVSEFVDWIKSNLKHD